jgi:tRNA pseudouridine38-40 synthase
VPNFRLTLEYDGTDFAGWQVQAGSCRTVQGALEAAIARVTGQTVRVAGASRTDAGVHAEGQVASARIETALAAAELQSALNGTLPSDAAVVEASRVPEDFHARYSAKGKLYSYRVWNHPSRSPLRRTRTYWVARPLDVAAMSCAARELIGRHDFAALQGSGSEVESSIRTIAALRIEQESSPELVFWVEGDGFLRHMVRNLVGTLLEVGWGRRSSESMIELLASGDRRMAGPTAPAGGLALIRVFY